MIKFLKTLILALALVLIPSVSNAQLTIPQGGTGLTTFSQGSIPFKDTNALRFATSSAFQFNNSLSKLSFTNGSSTAFTSTTLCLTADGCITEWPAGGAGFDSTTVDATTWSDGANASNVWTFDLSGTDTTLTFGSNLFTFAGGVTLTTGKNFILGTTQWNSGDGIDGEVIGVDTIDDDSIDFADVTLADLTFDVGSVDTTEFGYLNGVTSAIQTQLNAKQATLTADSITPDMVLSTGQTDEYVLTYEITGDTWAWQESVAGVTTLDGLSDVTITSLADNEFLLSASGVFINQTAGEIEGLLEAVLDLSDLQGAVTDGQVPNNITIDLATLATTLTVTDNEATNETNAILFTPNGDLDGGNLGIEADGDLTYNPSTGTLAATLFSGSGASLTALNATNLSSGTVPAARVGTDHIDAITEIAAALKDDTGACTAGLICLGGHTHAIASEISGLGTGVATFLATPSTANFASMVTGESGSGAVVFGTAPTLDAPVITTSIDLPAGAINAATEIGADLITHAQILDADQADTKCIKIESPVAADDLKSIWANKTANDFLITEIWGESDQTVSFDLQIDDGTPADVNGTDIAPAAGEAEDTSLSGDTTLAAGEELDLDITSVTNAPTWVTICWTGNWVD